MGEDNKWDEQKDYYAGYTCFWAAQAVSTKRVEGKRGLQSSRDESARR